VRTLRRGAWRGRLLWAPSWLMRGPQLWCGAYGDTDRDVEYGNTAVPLVGGESHGPVTMICFVEPLLVKPAGGTTLGFKNTHSPRLVLWKLTSAALRACDDVCVMRACVCVLPCASGGGDALLREGARVSIPARVAAWGDTHGEA
jgi:hypothetical protein